jgi:eukaryotic-like serine/threonine-protein kinase
MELLNEDDPRTVSNMDMLVTLTRRLGRGSGPGADTAVYLGVSRDRRLLAVKAALPLTVRDPAAGPDVAARLALEARATAAAAGEFSARLLAEQGPGTGLPWPPWFAVEYVAAPTLEDAIIRIRRGGGGGLPAEAVLRLAYGLAAVLARLGRLGLVHGDVSPPNILLGRGGPVLVDYELAHPAGPPAPGRPLVRAGTPGFTAPELSGPDAPGCAADVYSLGLVLAYAASGAHPLGDTPQERAHRLAAGPGQVLAELPGDLPQNVRTLIEGCLAGPPERRLAPAQILRATKNVAARRPAGLVWWPVEVMNLISIRERESRDAVYAPLEPGGVEPTRRELSPITAEGDAGAAFPPSGLSSADLPTLPPNLPPPSGPGSGARHGSSSGSGSSAAGSGRIPGGRGTRSAAGRAPGAQPQRNLGLFLVGALALVLVAGLVLALHPWSGGSSSAFSGPPKPPAPPYSWSVAAPPAYAESVAGHDVPIKAGQLVPACTVMTVSVELKNSGSDSWSSAAADGVTIETDAPASGCPSPPGSSALTLSGTVQPGVTGTFQGQLEVPSDGDLDATGSLLVAGSPPPRPGPTVPLHVAAAKVIGISNGSQTGAGSLWLGTLNGDVVSQDGQRTLAPASGYTRPTGVVGIACPDAGGCWLATGDGTVVPYGDVPALAPEAGSKAPTSDVVGIAATAGGFWLAQSTGYTPIPYGQAPYIASTVTSTNPPVEPICGIAADPKGHGYWMVASDGGVFTSQSVPGATSAVGDPRNVNDTDDDFVAIAVDPTGTYYYLVTSTGDVYDYTVGSSQNSGVVQTPAGSPPPEPIVGIAASADGSLHLADSSGDQLR